MQMTSGRAATSRRLTSAKAAWTRSTTARSSDGGRISSCGVWAQANAATSGTASPLPAPEETAVVFHPVEAEYGHAVGSGRRDGRLEVRAVARRHAAEHPRLRVRHDVAGRIEPIDGQPHARGPPVGRVVDVAAELRPLGVDARAPLQAEPAVETLGGIVLGRRGK